MAKKTAWGATGWALATALFGWAAGPTQAADCLAAPDGVAPDGWHWYYRLDRANNRQCWRLREAGLPTRPAAPPKTRRAESRRPRSAGVRAKRCSRNFLEWRKTQPAAE